MRTQIAACIGFFSLVPTPAIAQIDWNNAAGGNFLTASNWAGGITPGAADNVRVLIATSSPITLGSTTTINQFLFDNAGATMTHNGGTFTVGGLMTLNTGTFSTTGSFTVLNLNNGLTMNAGSFTLGTFARLNLTGTANLNGGTFQFNSGRIVGGTMTGGGNRLKVGGTSAILDGVTIGVNTLDFSTGGVRFEGGTNFAPASAYTFGTGFNLVIAQSGFSNVAFTMVNSTWILGGVASSTWSIGNSGTGAAAVTHGGTLQANLATAGGLSNNSLQVDGIIENTGTGDLLMSVSGTVTNGATGTMRLSAGTMTINSNPLGFTNNGLVSATGGTFTASPTGNVSNASTMTANGGNVTFSPTGAIANTGTINATNGIVRIRGTSTFSNTGTINIAASGTVRIQQNIAISDLGTVNRATPTTGTLAIMNNAVVTLSANTDIAPYGTISLSGSGGGFDGNSGTITSGSGGPFTISSSNGSQIVPTPLAPAGILDNVHLSNGILSYTGSSARLRIQGNTTFAANSSYTMATSSQLFVNQSGFSNVSWDLGYNGSIQGSVVGGTWTIGLSGTSTPAIRSNAPMGGTTGLGSSVANNSLINNDVIENIGVAALGISPSGNFTNNGTIRSAPSVGAGAIVINPTGNAVNNGTIIANGGSIFINPIGTFTTGPGSSMIVQGTGRIETPLGNITNSTTVNVLNGQFEVNIGIGSVGVYSNLGTTTVSVGSSVFVGNLNTSSSTNQGTWTVGTIATQGGTVTVGTTANPGTLTNSAGTFTLNGTANARTTVSGGRLTGQATINGTAASGLTLSGGILAPGNSPGQITIGGGLDIGGTLELDIQSGGGNNSNTQGTTTPGTGFDTIRVQPPPETNTASNVTIRTAATNFRLLTGNGSQSAFNADPFWTTSQRWAIVRTTSTNSGSVTFLDGSNNVQTLPVSATVSLFNADGTVSLNPTLQYPNGSFFYAEGPALDVNFNRQVDLVWTPVPEPGSVIAMLAFATATGTGLRRRRGATAVTRAAALRGPGGGSIPS
jgi:fibronectin-binding autotransporter adhesin